MRKQRHIHNYFSHVKCIVLSVLTVMFCMVVRAQSLTRPTAKAVNGFEVNSYTGNLFYRRTDLFIPGRGFPIDISFSYNSNRSGRNWGTGKGWTFTYNMAYVPDNEGIYIERSDGRKDLFKKNGAVYISPTGVFDLLIEYEPGKFYLREKSGTRYFFENSAHKRLTRMEDRNGNAFTFAYTDTLLRTLTDASGRTCTFNWQGGLLTSIVDNSASPARRLSYGYDAAGNLTQAADPMNHTVTYYYNAGSKLIGMTDKRGYNTSVVYHQSNAVAKIVSCVTTQEFAYVAAQLTTYETEMVSGQKQITSFKYDNRGRLLHKQGNCCGYNLSYQYDDNNNIAGIKNGINQETRYEYDEKGNLLKQTDALGNSVAYTYDPVYNQVTSIKDKQGNTFTTEYDAKGNLVKTTKPLGVVESYTYAANGDLISYTDGNNNTTRYEYNPNGYIVKVTNNEGGILTYTYDNSGNRTSETDARKYTTSYTYDALNNITRITDPLNHVTAYEYDAAGNRTSETNALNKQTKYEYDGINRQLSTTSPLGIVTKTVYDEKGNVVQSIDGRGNTTSYTFNSRNLALSMTDALGNTETYEYDGAGNKTRMTDKNGNSTLYEYDAANRQINATDSRGGVTASSYDGNGNRLSTTYPTGNNTSYTYDALNRLVKITDAVGKSIVYEYDANNNRTAETDKKGNKTTYEYDKLNRLKKLTNALNGIETYTYDSSGNQLTRTDALNHVTTNTYDASNRLVSVTDAVGDVTSYTYDGAGNIITTVMPNGNTVVDTYDADNRHAGETDNLGTVVQYGYDNNGNITNETDGENNTTAYQYDAANRLVKIVSANGATRQFVYDKNDNKLQDIDQKGYATLYEYDVLNRLVKTTDVLGFSSRFVYDANGNRTNIIDAKGNTTSYSFDPLNRITKQVFPDGTTKQFTYDANDNLATRTDNNGVLTQYRYDKLNRLTAKSYPNNQIDSFRYDAASRMTGAINPNATVQMEYDGVSRLLKETLNGKEISYTYNDSDRKKSITYPGGMQIGWNLDYRDRLSQIDEGGSRLATFQYDKVNRLTAKQYRNNTATTYTYDRVSNMTGIQVTPGNIMHVNYTYDSLDNRMLSERLHQPNASEQYGYDKLSQLKSFASGKVQNGSLVPAKQHVYNYDGMGNRTTTQEDGVNRTYTANNLNQYKTVVTNGINTTFEYDKNGNTLADSSNTYAYDFESRLIRIQTGSTVMSYGYDALGRKISQVVNGTEKGFFYDQDNLVQETENGITRNYVYGAGIDQILYSRKESLSLYFHTDDLNSVQSLTDAAGNMVEWYTYNDFGYPHIYNSSNVETGTSAVNNILFTGRFYESSSKTYDFRNRQVNALTGRFLQRDLLRNIDEWNVYAYVKNDPVNFVDPLGLVRWKGVFWAGLGIAGNTLGVIGGVALGAGTSWTGGGAILGGAIAVKSGYGVGANAANLWAAINDEEGPSTGSLLNDAARWYDPCNEALQWVATGLDIGTDVAGLVNSVPKTAGALGKAGEKAVGITGPKTQIPSLTKTAKYRVPERLTQKTLEEVKNVASQSLTAQLRDFYQYAQQTGRQFVLYTRPDTKISGPLQKLIDEGKILRKDIPSSLNPLKPSTAADAASQANQHLNNDCCN